MAETVETVDIVVTSRVPPHMSKPAKLSVCGKCGCNTWMIYHVEGDQHPHLQCANELCAETYCAGEGECGK